MAEPDRNVFILVRGQKIEDNPNNQLVEMLVPGFNASSSYTIPIDDHESETVKEHLDKFRLELVGYINDWQQALYSDDDKLKAKFPNRDYYELCWKINDAVNGLVNSLGSQK